MYSKLSTTLEMRERDEHHLFSVNNTNLYELT